MTEGSERRVLVDAVSVITRDLGRLHKRRRQRLVVVGIASTLAVVGMLASVGARPDWLEQPLSRLVVHAIVVGLGLVVFPAIGFGLLFPRPKTRYVLVAAAVLAGVAVALAWPPSRASTAALTSNLSCMLVTATTGLVLLVIGLVGRVFRERPSGAGVFWLAASLYLLCSNAIACHCPNEHWTHTLPSHLAAALLMGLGAAAIGSILPRQR